MPLQIRRGSTTERQSITPLIGELIFDTTTKTLFIGDGTQAGGISVGSSGGGASSLNDLTDVYVESPTSGQVLTFDGINWTPATPTSGTTDQIEDAVYQLFNAGTHTGISYTYDDNLNKIDSTIDLTNYGGDILGTIQGSVIGLDTQVLVDASTREFYGSVITNNVSITPDQIVAQTNFSLGSLDSPMALSLNLNENLKIRWTSVDDFGKFIILTQSRGTVLAPEAVLPGDELGGLLFKGYTNATTSAIAGTIGFFVDPDAVIAGGDFVKSKMFLAAATDTGQEVTDALLLDSAGLASSNAFIANKYMQLPVYADDAARSAAIPTPAQGMMVFMSSGTAPAVSNRPVIYNGTEWTTF